MNELEYKQKLRTKFESYAPISNETWERIESFIRFQELSKNEMLLRSGQIAKKIHFVCKGALRAFVADSDGNTYNKNIFLENDFAGSTVSYLRSRPSRFAIESLEETTLISLNYQKYREVIDHHPDMKNFYVAYLENNWIVEKEEREVSIVMENATDRYLKLLRQHPDIDQRIQKIHIASHIGVTPTQLSRIRKKLKEKSQNQPM